MSQIDPILVQDNLLSCEDKVKYAVFSGGQSITTQRFPATSSSASQIVGTIQVPSTNVVMDRRVLVRYSATITGTAATADTNYPIEYGAGGNAVLAPFPLNQNITNISVQINNTTVSQTTQQVLDPLLRCLEKQQLAEYSGSAPTKLDNATPYDTTNTSWPSSAWGTYDSAVDTYCPPRGAFPVTLTQTAAAGPQAAQQFSITWSAAEPLMVSPFVYGDDSEECAGIYGVSQINVNMSLDASCKRALRNSLTAAAPSNGAITITGITYNNVEFECRFLSPPASALLPMTNIVPYSSIVNYQTTLNSACAAGASATITSSNVQLNAVPDKVFLFVKKSQNEQTIRDADCYGSITNVSINWNNNAGLLSGTSQQSLWRMSREAGCLESWLEFSGLAGYTAPGDFGATAPNIGTVGSVLVLDFGRHIQLQEDWYAAGSIGSFNFQVQVQYTNNTGTAFATPQLNVAFLSSGVFATTNGQSAAYIGVLNKQEVLAAKEQEPVSHHTLQRLVGGKGGLFHGLRAMANRAFRFAKHHPSMPHLKSALSAASPKAAQAVHALSALTGLGEGMDGGRKKGRLHSRII